MAQNGRQRVGEQSTKPISGPTKEVLKMISLNANGLRAAPKRRAVFSYLHKLQADILLLQETHCTQADQKIWLSKWGGAGFFCNGRSNARGVCMLLNRNYNPKILKQVTDDDGRLLLLQFKRKDDTITVANVYAPTQSEAREQEHFISRVDQELNNLEISELYIGGDFDTKFQARSDPNFTTTYTEGIQNILDEFQLADVWKEKNPTITRGTFHRASYTTRLDYWFIPAWTTSQTSTSIIPYPLSDHSIITIEIKYSDNPRGPGFWRLDNNLLQDPTFIKEMKTYLEELGKEKLGEPNLQWEWIKFNIKTFCIRFSSRKNREKRKMVSDLEKRLQQLAEENDLVDSPEVIAEVQSLRRELSEIYQSQANATIFKAKARWSMFGEKPSAYLLGLEKRRSKDNTITSLINDSGRIITSNQQILEMERDFFSKIYKEDQSTLEPLHHMNLSAEEIPQVSELNRLRINRPFTSQELHAALKDLNKNKTPGSDGLTPEYYLAFWDILKDDFLASIEFSLENDSMSEQQRTGIITLIPKRDLDRNLLSNWRHITLLNSDFKILSKALAKRIQSCISEVVSEDQTGFIRGRSITSNLHNIQTIINQADASGDPQILLA